MPPKVLQTKFSKGGFTCVQAGIVNARNRLLSIVFILIGTKPMSIKTTGLAILIGACAGCASLATSTNTLSEERIKSETSGALGYSPEELSIVSRRTEGVNTYVNLKAKDGKEFTCIINGGNLLSFGMTNPPMCNKKGEPVKASPFQR